MAKITQKLIIIMTLILSFTSMAMDEHPFSLEVRKVLLSVEKEDLRNFTRDEKSCVFFQKINDLFVS